MKQFQVYDLYECYGEVGQFDTLSEAEKAAERHKEETDGECDLLIREWDEIYRVYVTIKREFSNFVKGGESHADDRN